jgi:Icc-related predicted phosphoesterase
MTKICIVSDTHGAHWDLDIPKCDILIHCGDWTNLGRYDELMGFNRWVGQIKEKGLAGKVVAIPGNHDLGLERFPEVAGDLTNIDHLLIHQGAEVDGLKIWGCPYVPTFFNWAYMKDEDDLYWIYNQIPVNLDILICHGPPRGHCDWNGREHCGSTSMKEVLAHKQPKYYLCGHIHDSRGVSKIKHYNGKETVVINAASSNPNYAMLPPMILEI